MAINIGGTADAELIRGARHIARQKYQYIPPPVDKTSAIASSAVGSIVDAMGIIKKKKEQLEIEHEKNLKPFQEIADKARQKLSVQQEPLPQKVVDAVEGEITRLQDEFEKVNIVGKGDTRENERARTKIMAELTRVTNEAINTRANFMMMGQSAGNWNPNLIDPRNIDPMKSIMDLENMDKNDNISVAFIDGKLTFNTKNYSTSQVKGHIEKASPDAIYVEGYTDTGTTDEVVEEYQYGEPMSFTAEDMFKALPTKNLDNDSMLLASQTSFSMQGKNDGKYNEINYFRNTDGTLNQYAFDEEKNALAGEIMDEKQFQDMASRRMAKMGMPSFKMALRDRVDIPMAALENMFVDDNGERIEFDVAFANMDKNEDGLINQEDLVGLEGEKITAFENNLDEIINALTNINHPAFNLEESKDILADYYTNMKMQAYENNYYANGGKKTWEENVEGVEEGRLNNLIKKA